MRAARDQGANTPPDAQRRAHCAWHCSAPPDSLPGDPPPHRDATRDLERRSQDHRERREHDAPAAGDRAADQLGPLQVRRRRGRVAPLVIELAKPAEHQDPVGRSDELSGVDRTERARRPAKLVVHARDALQADGHAGPARLLRMPASSAQSRAQRARAGSPRRGAIRIVPPSAASASTAADDPGERSGASADLGLDRRTRSGSGTGARWPRAHRGRGESADRMTPDHHCRACRAAR